MNRSHQRDGRQRAAQSPGDASQRPHL